MERDYMNVYYASRLHPTNATSCSSISLSIPRSLFKPSPSFSSSIASSFHCSVKPDPLTLDSLSSFWSQKLELTKREEYILFLSFDLALDEKSMHLIPMTTKNALVRNRNIIIQCQLC
jgi:hypothetical protein